MGRWKHTEGERPNTVTVEEREPGGVLYVRVWNPLARGGKGNWERRSLGYRDKRRAKLYAKEQAVKLEKGDEDIRAGRMTLGRLFTLYEKHRTPRKSPTEQAADRRRFKLWKRFLGATKDPHLITLAEWEGFIDARRGGLIDGCGRVAPEGVEKPVGNRTVQADLDWLKQVLKWGTEWQDREGRYLLREVCVRGRAFKDATPKEKNPRRPVASHDRYEALRAVSDHVQMEIRWRGKRKKQRSYLSELLDLVAYTGRRISPVCRLRYEDLRLDRTKDRPHGAIQWPGETDKEGKAWSAPLHPVARAAIDRIRRARPWGEYLFPSPMSRDKPISRHLAHDWLKRGEELAKLKPLKRGKWHAYRRKWATERKAFPDADVAAAGGWSGVESLRASYQHADDETALRVVLEPSELREANQ